VSPRNHVLDVVEISTRRGNLCELSGPFKSTGSLAPLPSSLQNGPFGTPDKLAPGRCHIKYSRREKSSLRCGLSSKFFDDLFSSNPRIHTAVLIALNNTFKLTAVQHIQLKLYFVCG